MTPLPTPTTEFDFVLCAGPEPIAPSAEFAEGLARLHQQTGRQAHWLFAAADTPPLPPWQALRPLLEQLLQRADQCGASAQASVLLLAHAQVQLVDASMQWLREAVTLPARLPGRDQDSSTGTGTSSTGRGSPHGLPDIALCWSAVHPPPGLPPHYATLRGMERYVQLLRQALPAQPLALAQPTLPAGALAAATTVQAVRRWLQGEGLSGAWLPGGYAHDFSNYHQGHEGRRDMLDWVPATARRVLDVGGGEGHFLALLRAERGCETHLSEFSPAACALAAARVDHAWPGDFLQLAPASLPEGGRGAFDCITFLDSLEHAPEPGLWLDKAHALLAPGGCIVGSVPNVGHWSVIADLLEGRWDYCPVGIHCNTHLRFFTQRTLTDLLARHGFAVQALQAVPVPAPEHWRAHWLATPGLQTQGAQLDAYAFVFRAGKGTGHSSRASSPFEGGS